MKGSEDQIDKILSNWLIGEASQEELEMLKEWASQSEENLNTLETFKRVWKEKNSEPVLVHVEEKINDIWQNGKLKKEERKAFLYPYLKIAAVFLFLIGASFGFYYWIQLDSLPQAEVPIQVQSFVIKENKPGQKTKISLPDGTIAYLNSSSRLKFLEGFVGSERRVMLEGEAYFEVAKDQTKPFIVESKTVETLALGTAFNVHAFPDSKVVKVSLLEGEVRVHQVGNTEEAVVLNPGRQLIVEPETQSSLESSFNHEEVIGWKDGKLVFRNASFQEVTQRLERWYGVHILVKGTVPTSWKVSTLYDGQSLKNVLTDLQYSKKFAYEIDDTKVTITF